MNQTPRVRHTAVAGRFYPAEPEQLREAVEGFVQRGRDTLQDMQMEAPAGPQSAVQEVTAGPEMLPGSDHPAGHVQAILAPHAGYPFSGGIAGLAFAAAAGQASWAAAALAGAPARAAPQRVPERIVLAGPAHYHAFEGVALPGADYFSSPLGQVPVDTGAVARIRGRHATASILPEAHAPEHSLEVMLPFLQQLWDGVPILPLLCGRVSPETVVDLLADELRPGDLLVISSDLSHFHPADRAEAMDLRLLDALEAGDYQGVADGEACGIIPLLAAMQLVGQRDWGTRVLGYAHSGSVSGDLDRVVGYGAAAFSAAASVSAASPAREKPARGDGA